MAKKRTMSSDKHRKQRAYVMLILAAALWGFNFVFQKKGESAGTFTFSTMRMLIASAALGPVLLIRRKSRKSGAERIPAKETLRGGLLCGIFYFIGIVMQQAGLAYLSVGRSGFICASYTVMVPFLAVLFGKKVSKNAWIGAFLCIGGLYLLCAPGTGGGGIGLGEVLTLIGAFGCAMQIIAIDRFAEKIDGIALSFAQSLTAAVLGLPLMFMIDHPTWDSILSVLPSLLYVGVAATAAAYPLQAAGQKEVGPAEASITISLESVFSVIAGAVFLNERMRLLQYAGCALIFAAAVLAQLPGRQGKAQLPGKKPGK
ncbi:MAG: DMT family transporter [Eubacteriales bacterium]|nr:DMT family transporter [Eubacteriales bacterium]